MDSNIELDFLLQLLTHRDNGKNLSFTLASVSFDKLYLLVMQHRVWHLVKNSLNTQQLPTSFAERLAQHCYQDAIFIFRSAVETIKISKTFAQHNIVHCFIKGTILNDYLYGALVTRPCKDIDVWVDAPHYEASIAQLLQLGYKQTFPTYELAGFKKDYYLTHKHDIEFYHEERQMVVELHFRLNYFGINFFTLSNIPLQQIALLNTSVTTMADDYHVLYLMLHGAIHGWMRLRWLQDIALFINNKRCNLLNVRRLAQELQCVHIFMQALLLTHDFFVIKDANYLLLIQNPSRRVRRLVAMAKAFIAANYTLVIGIKNIKMFVLYRIYLVNLAQRDQKIRAVFGDLFKIDVVFESMTLPKPLLFMYYLLYPVVMTKKLWRSKY